MFYSKVSSIDAAGTDFLVDRQLSIPEAIKSGIAAADGVIYFDYRRDGRHIRTKARSQDDKKKQWWDGEPTHEPLPFFNMTIQNASNSHSNDPSLRQLIITEGEFDCVALSQLEACKCVSLHGGAGSAEKCIKDNAEFLTHFDEIYIAFDMDEPGHKAAEKVRSLIDPKKYRKINFPKGSKDANEWLINESPEKEDLLRLMQNAEKLSCPEIVHWDELPDSIHDPLEIGISTGWSKLDNMIGGIRLGEVTVITADTASGKTTFCINLLINILKQNKKVWINSYEMKTQVIYRKISSHFLGVNMKYNEYNEERINKIMDERKKYGLYINPTDSSPDLSSISRQLELCSFVYGINYVLIDHFDYIHSTVKKSNQYERIDEAIKQLHNMALYYNVHVFLVVHTKQNDNPANEITMADIKGSSGIKQYADNILVLNRMSRRDTSSQGQKDTRTKVYISKNRLYGNEGPIYLNYEKSFDGFVQTLDL